MGHEIEETITDPGAEDVINGVNLGGWYAPTTSRSRVRMRGLGAELGGAPSPPPAL